ncbi:thiolase-like protein [Trichoderma barbatum]
MVSPRAQKKIAVVGQGCRLPGGVSSPQNLWELLLKPRDLHAETPSHWKNIGLSSNDASRSYFLSEDPRRFDRQFFHMHTAEAEATDPQFRLALECVYEALEDAGLPMESLSGSSTAVYAGLSGTDYANLVTRDALQVPPYAATGTHANMLSNRISYFYNWRGPSMTIDTACSSSLVALDLAVQSLRRDECQMAVVCSSNLLLDSDIYTTADNLGLLSPSGRCHSFDSRANGYARGEGIIAIILKTVDLAVSDGNKIRCVVRETGVNHDGYKAGIALPNSAAQQSLIETTYARAGLDSQRARDQCQYIEAHGTGTRAGDPIEAEALSQAFFGDHNHRDSDHAKRSISLGSIKSVVGHLEGCAGLAGILKASLMTQHGVIPPHFDFKQLHDDAKPFCANFEIPQNAKPWPTLPETVPRRVSVNSFGFGGTNAHAIIEEYLPDIHEPKAMPIDRGEIENGVLPVTYGTELDFRSRGLTV